MAPKSSKSTKLSREIVAESEPSSSAESSHEVEGSSASESEEEKSNRSSASESDDESATSSKKRTDAQADQKSSRTRAFRQSQAYKPPVGFKSAKNQSLSSSKASPILSDLRGKQVFHITAPAFLPLSKVKEVTLSRALQGEPILKHDGVQYGIPVDSHKQADAGGQTLFLYDSETETYYSTVTNIPTYRIQEMIDLPNGHDYEETIMKAAKSVEKPPRKQPKHLKMRFRPVGSGDAPPETLGSSSEESEGEEPTFKVPKDIEKEKDRKRKHQQTEGDGCQSAGIPRKKSKKHSEDIGESAEREKSKKSKDRDGKKRKKEKAA